MIEIPLTKGKFGIIDEEDFFIVSQYRWWAKQKKGKWYVETKIDGKNVSFHRFLMNAPKGTLIDHQDGDGLNNQRSNLRFASSQQNCWNMKKQVGREYKGVSFRRDRGCYRAYITMEDKYYHLGHFSTAELAATAYDKAAKELFADFANLNFAEVAA
jgi:hypothetical protein